MRHTRLLAVLLWGLCTSVHAQVVPREVADAFLNKRTVPEFPKEFTFREAYNFQEEYLQLLTDRLGPRIGYKVGLVTRAGQERLGLSGPLRGVLLRRMMLPNKASVPVGYGVRPIVEVDLMVRIKDGGVNAAKTPEEALAHISEIVGFIELADNLLAGEAPTSGPIITALNVGARAGVVGEVRKVEPTAEFLKALAEMEMIMRDKEGKEISRSKASDIMGHPLNPLVWLVQDLKKRGASLREGDLVSLGSPAPQISPKAGDAFTLVYVGLPGGPLETSMSITE